MKLLHSLFYITMIISINLIAGCTNEDSSSDSGYYFKSTLKEKANPSNSININWTHGSSDATDKGAIPSVTYTSGTHNLTIYAFQTAQSPAGDIINGLWVYFTVNSMSTGTFTGGDGTLYVSASGFPIEESVEDITLSIESIDTDDKIIEGTMTFSNTAAVKVLFENVSFRFKYIER